MSGVRAGDHFKVLQVNENSDLFSFTTVSKIKNPDPKVRRVNREARGALGLAPTGLENRKGPSGPVRLSAGLWLITATF